MTLFSLRSAFVTLALGALGALACSSGGSGTSTPAAADGGPVADAATTPDSSTDAATAADTSVVPMGKGLIISNATVATLDGTYDIKVTRFAAAGGGGGYAYNGNFDGKIEIEIDTDAAGVVKTAHVWNYKGAGATLTPDKFYGCDAKATACTGVTVNVTTNVITLGGVTWPEVDSPAFDGSKPDTLVSGGGKVTVSGTIQATL